MATLPNTMDTYRAAFDAAVVRGGGRFLTDEDRDMALNRAAIKAANKLGGLNFYYEAAIAIAVSPSPPIVEYIIPDNIFKLVGPIYVRYDDGNRDYVDVVDRSQFRQLVDEGRVPSSPLAFYDRNRTTAVTAEGILEFKEEFAKTGFLEIQCKGVPNDLTTNPLVADITQINAVVEQAMSIARLRSRDLNEAKMLHDLANESAEDAAVMESRKNETSRIQMGYKGPQTRLRSRG